MKRTQIKRFPIADTALESLEPEAKEYRIKDSESLYFRVAPSGKKSWVFRYKREDGKWSWISLGSYPLVSGAKARKKARELLNDIVDGKNPVFTKKQKQEKELSERKDLFKALAHEWLTIRQGNWVEATFVRNKGALEKHIFPKFGHRPFDSILAVEWFNHLRAIQVEQGINEQVKRILTMCRDIYNLAKVTGRIEYNPLEGIHKYLESGVSKSMPHVSTEDVPNLLRTIRRYPTEETRIGLLLLSYLFCRPSELREATWDEFNFKTKIWSIPAERMKKRREHIVPLPKQVCELLNRLKELNPKSDYLFPSRTDVNEPASETVFIMALRRLGYAGRQTPHGFRHIASTILNEQDYDERHVEFSLAHVQGGVKGKYNKAKYFPQRVELMQEYADYLDEISA
jgi:integrase